MWKCLSMYIPCTYIFCLRLQKIRILEDACTFWIFVLFCFVVFFCVWDNGWMLILGPLSQRHNAVKYNGLQQKRDQNTCIFWLPNTGGMFERNWHIIWKILLLSFKNWISDCETSEFKSKHFFPPCSLGHWTEKFGDGKAQPGTEGRRSKPVSSYSKT